MQDIVKICLSSDGDDPLIIHAVSDEWWGVEDGLSILENPIMMLDRVFSVWPDHQLYVFSMGVHKRTYSEIVKISKEWGRCLQGVGSWAFAALLDKQSLMSEVVEYLQEGYFQDSSRIEILSRHNGQPKPEVRERCERGRKVLKVIEDLAGFAPRVEAPDPLAAIKFWKQYSPVVLMPFYTLHGEGLAFYLRDDDREVSLEAIKGAVRGFADIEGVEVNTVANLREMYGALWAG